MFQIKFVDPFKTKNFDHNEFSHLTQFGRKHHLTPFFMIQARKLYLYYGQIFFYYYL